MTRIYGRDKGVTSSLIKTDTKQGKLAMIKKLGE